MSNVLSTALAYKTLKSDKPETTGAAPSTFKESIFSKPLTWAIIIGVGGYALIRSLKKSPEEKRQDRIKEDIKEAEKTQKLSYPLSSYQGFADKIFSGWSTNYNPFDRLNEEPIYEVFKAMKNDLDVLELIKAFGKRREPTAIIGLLNNVALPEWLAVGMDTDEIDQVNSILASKGIKYRF